MGVRTPPLFGLPLAVLVSCGPSLTTVREGTIRFEHCYRLDLEPQASAAQRRSCWQHWVSSHTLGQPRDRIEYAARRLSAIGDGGGPSPELALGPEHRPEERQFYLVVPGPTSVHAPPPPVATVVQAAPPVEVLDGGATPSERAKTGEPKQPPAASCAGSCEGAWQSCEATCASGKPNACETCKLRYSKCMRSCFE
jgi:hypothetical protein